MSITIDYLLFTILLCFWMLILNPISSFAFNYETSANASEDCYDWANDYYDAVDVGAVWCDKPLKNISFFAFDPILEGVVCGGGPDGVYVNCDGLVYWDLVDFANFNFFVVFYKILFDLNLWPLAIVGVDLNVWSLL